MSTPDSTTAVARASGGYRKPTHFFKQCYTLTSNSKTLRFVKYVIPFLENDVDPDQLVPAETSSSGSGFYSILSV